jgi:hypothetical protein
LGLGSVPAPTFAEEDAAPANGAATESGEGAPQEESEVKKLEEEVLKELEANKDQPADSIMESEGSDH